MIKKLNSILTHEDKKIIFYLVCFSIFISLVETLGVSIIMPFISIATNFDLLESNKYYVYIYEFFGFETKIDFIVIFGLLLFVFYLFRSALNLLYFYLLAKFSKSRYQIIVTRLFKKYLAMSYKKFLTKNSSTLTKTIITEASGFSEVLSAVLLMISEVFIILFIYILLLYVNYQVTLGLTLFLLINSFFLIKIISPKLKQIGIENEKVVRHFYEIINKSFGNFKLIKLHTQNDDTVSLFYDVSLKSSKLAVKNSTFSHIPRLFLEAIAFGLLSLTITYYIWATEKNISEYLPVISIFVMALYRLMPSINRLISSYNLIMYYSKSLDIIYNDLFDTYENLGNKTIDLHHSIKLNDVGFSYNEGQNIISKVNLVINKGEKVAFIGESGSGKSTIVDLIIGLHIVKTGKVLVDNHEINHSNLKSWRKKIGYIPQSVYLFDGTVAQNIAFGSEIDENRIIKVLRLANIYDFLVKKDGIKTKVGEGGVMLSGGQKQRIAIARALYTDPEVLVLDEATSALDNETEKKIMEEIYNLSDNKTLIIIAHRLSSIDKCEKIYKLNNGEIINV